MNQLNDSKQSSLVEDKLKHLAEVCNELSAQIQRLSDRLEPVLMPVSDDKEVAGPRPPLPPLPAFVETINNRIDDVENVLEKVISTIQRLAI